MTFFSSGISLQSDLSHLKNDFKLQDMIVSSPTSSTLYIAGMTLAEIVYSLAFFRYSYCSCRNLFASFASSNSNLNHCIVADVRYFSSDRFHVIYFLKMI